MTTKKKAKPKKERRTTMMKNSLAFIALSLLTACDYVNSARDLRDDREDSTYRAALADYRAGRLDAAARGFAKAIRKNPSNAEARFQYACLMQDTKKDYLEAYFSYREYLLQHPESDKAKIARDRLGICERELAKELAEKHRLLGGEAFAKEIDALKKDLKAAEDRAASAEKLLAAERDRYRSLSSEHDRLVAAVKTTGDEEVTAPRRTTVNVKDILDEEEDETPAASSSPAATEVAKLKSEEAEETSSGTSLLPVQTAEDRARRDAAEKAQAEAKRLAEERAAAERAKRPPVYVVQEGDTLYKIALRFYGRVSAWRQIRDANRATISTDGRVKTGQKINLP
jgi:LysM repeat protein